MLLSYELLSFSGFQVGNSGAAFRSARHSRAASSPYEFVHGNKALERFYGSEGIINEMETKRTFQFPDPFSPAEHAAFTARVMGALPARRARWGQVWAVAASLGLVFGLLALTRHMRPGDTLPAAPVHVANPLHLAQAMPGRTEVEGAVAFPRVAARVQKMDVPFQISKTDHRVQLAWEKREGYQYIVQKCVLSAKGKSCQTTTVVSGGAFQDKSADETPLVMYTVEAVKS
jgi:hypothetical protein